MTQTASNSHEPVVEVGEHQGTKSPCKPTQLHAMIRGMTGWHEILRRRDGIVTQQASQTLVLLDVEGGEYYSLNVVGARAWELCDGSRSVEEVIAIIRQEYDAPEEDITTDVMELLEDLTSESLLVKVAP